MLIIAIGKGWRVRQIDVNNYFLHGVLDKEVYMDFPPGYEAHGYLCLLKKALYRLKQAPRAWFSKLSYVLLSFDSKDSKAYPSLFMFKSIIVHILVLVYINDILITDNDNTTCQTLINHLDDLFALKDLGNLSYFL